MIWVTTYPTPNMGEANRTPRSICSERATKAPPSADVAGDHERLYAAGAHLLRILLYQYFEKYLDALLHPGYTEEEVHREVRNFGVQPMRRLFRAATIDVYGPEHPYSFSSGGDFRTIRHHRMRQPFSLLSAPTRTLPSHNRRHRRHHRILQIHRRFAVNPYERMLRH
jgi:hypothetical protein